jgi:quercetin dioxygenase-like cupin family protein
MPAHHHIAEQMGIVLDGSMTITAGGRSETVRAGSLYRIGPDVPHGVHAGPEGCTIIEMFSPAREGVPRLE